MKPESQTKLMIEDPRLGCEYSVQEVAMIAASCRGDSPEARIEEALDLLSAAERQAYKDKYEKQKEWNIKHGHSDDFEPEKKFIESNKKRFLKAKEICRQAKRDATTGKIERTDLVRLIYMEAGLGEDSKRANRLYNEWLDYAAKEDANNLTFEEMIRHLGPQPWDDDKLKDLYKNRASEASAVLFKTRYESGKKTPLIHDDAIAKNLVCDFLAWLEKRERKSPSKIIRSKNDGKIVSPKNRGSIRDQEGKFRPKKTTDYDVEEHILPKRENSSLSREPMTRV